ESAPPTASEPVAAAPAAAVGPEKRNASPDIPKCSGELASVGQTASPGARPEAPTGSPGRPEWPSGADRGREKPPKRSWDSQVLMVEATTRRGRRSRCAPGRAGPGRAAGGLRPGGG